MNILNIEDKYEFADSIKRAYNKHGNGNWVDIANDIILDSEAGCIRELLVPESKFKRMDVVMYRGKKAIITNCYPGKYPKYSIMFQDMQTDWAYEEDIYIIKRKLNK